MTAVPPSAVGGLRTPLQLSRLWRDENIRGVAIQILVVFAFFAIFVWLASNVAANFLVLNKSFGFEFLWTLPANYDINQSLIDYNNQDTHLRAALVGLINTFLVALVGIVIATFMGFFLGALRIITLLVKCGFAVETNGTPRSCNPARNLPAIAADCFSIPDGVIAA